VNRMSPKQVAISIVNWNTREQLRRCLSALRDALRGIDGEVCVVDNASSDGSAEMVRREFPEVRLFALDENLGFAGGNNVVLRRTTAEYVLILNPDVEVSSEALTGMLEFLDHNPDTAAVAPLLVGQDGKPHTYLYRRFPTLTQVLLFWTAFGLVARQVPVLRRNYAEHDIAGAEPIPVDQLPGAAILLRSSVVHQVGEWDADYFIWFEDVDWCYRVRQAGHQLYVLPDARVRHEGGASFRSWSMQKRVYQFYRTFFRFLCKHRLDKLQRVALNVLTVDLYLREAGLRAVKLTTGRDIAGIRSLAPTRQAIREVVERHRAGELVAFTDAGTAHVVTQRSTRADAVP
jgi:N-acetylglucosaminyl-diphospho-decaprenol L-rhamnosyltransferase